MSENTVRPPRDWPAYYAKTGGRPPRKTVLLALDKFDDEGGDNAGRLAVDLGCGSGRDAVEIARRGWRVLGIDPEPSAIEGLLARPELEPDAKVEGKVVRMEDATWPACDLVNSSFALPLCPPDRFDDLWARIIASLKPGGRFSGQFYGNKDSWFGKRNLTFHTRAEAEARLKGLELEMFDEEEDDSTTPRGEVKHWHIFHVVARKPA